jgi:hypothetical protein
MTLEDNRRVRSQCCMCGAFRFRFRCIFRFILLNIYIYIYIQIAGPAHAGKRNVCLLHVFQVHTHGIVRNAHAYTSDDVRQIGAPCAWTAWFIQGMALRDLEPLIYTYIYIYVHWAGLAVRRSWVWSRINLGPQTVHSVVMYIHKQFKQLCGSSPGLGVS